MPNSDSSASAPKYWRNLEHKDNQDTYAQYIEKEFPSGAQEMSDPLTRRNFMNIMGASAALAGLTACRMPKEKILPFVKSPKNMIPGTPKYYATSMNIGQHVQGLLVENNEGRPTHIQGNEKHPASLGSPGLFAQASILSLYDPDRLKVPSENGTPKTWAQFETFWRDRIAPASQKEGQNMLVLTHVSPSPTLERLKTAFLKTYPAATWLNYESVHHEHMHDAMAQLGQSGMEPLYDYDKADIVLSLGHDFLGTDLNAPRYQKAFAQRRRVQEPGQDLQNAYMSRLYALESGFTLTGSNADHRLKLNPSQIPAFVASIYQALAQHIALPKIKFKADAFGHQAWIQALAADLMQHPGSTLISAGLAQSAEVHVMAQLMNQALSNVGQTVHFAKPPSTASRLAQIKATLESPSINTLITIGCNPVYDLGLDTKDLAKNTTWIAASLAPSESTASANWVLPLSHYLESWSDAQTIDQIQTINQPMIQPLFDSKSAIEIAQLLTGLAPVSGYALVRKTWEGKSWDQALHDGVFGTPVLQAPQLQAPMTLDTQSTATELEVEFLPSFSVYDGRFANNGWLQEMPHPITKVAWDNPALISPQLARDFKLKNGQKVRLANGETSIDVPVWIVPGQPNQTITLEMGYGRSLCGRVGQNVGTNVLPLRDKDFAYTTAGITLSPLGDVAALANTQDHGSMEGRPLVREATLAEFKKHPEFAKEAVHHPPLKSLWKEHDYSQGYQWGMSIDLNTCTGCNACMIACQSENNIPIVGKKQVELGREMSWIRMDRYFTGTEDDPMVVFQPVACAQCENAPCEQVCPVNATVHDDEGLNTMVYNRCIGTRYCSNNCPYKVRRFNFFNYIKESPIPTSTSPLVQMANNPEVTIRFRGVMEKCTYCTQRIEEGRSKAKLDNRKMVDGDVKTACQVACPSDAIVFGNINDPDSEVTKLKALNQDYAMLAEINIKPRTTYLAKLRNPNPKLVKADTQDDAHQGGHA